MILQEIYERLKVSLSSEISESEKFKQILHTYPSIPVCLPFQKQVTFTDNFSVDFNSSILLESKSYRSKLRKIPVTNTGNGDCFWKSVSQALFGQEKEHLTLRVFCAYFMIQNEAIMKKKLKKLERKYHLDDSVTFVDHVAKVLTLGVCSDVVCFKVAAEALQVRIVSEFPNVTFPGDLNHKLYNYFFQPKSFPFHLCHEKTVTIMWTFLGELLPNKPIIFNHFVTVLDLPSTTIQFIKRDITNSFESIPDSLKIDVEINLTKPSPQAISPLKENQKPTQCEVSANDVNICSESIDEILKAYAEINTNQSSLQDMSLFRLNSSPNGSIPLSENSINISSESISEAVEAGAKINAMYSLPPSMSPLTSDDEAIEVMLPETDTCISFASITKAVKANAKVDAIQSSLQLVSPIEEIPKPTRCILSANDVNICSESIDKILKAYAEINTNQSLQHLFTSSRVDHGPIGCILSEIDTRISAESVVENFEADATLNTTTFSPIAKSPPTIDCMLSENTTKSSPIAKTPVRWNGSTYKHILPESDNMSITSSILEEAIQEYNEMNATQLTPQAMSPLKEDHMPTQCVTSASNDLKSINEALKADPKTDFTQPSPQVMSHSRGDHQLYLSVNDVDITSERISAISNADTEVDTTHSSAQTIPHLSAFQKLTKCAVSASDVEICSESVAEILKAYAEINLTCSLSQVTPDLKGYEEAIETMESLRNEFMFSATKAAELILNCKDKSTSVPEDNKYSQHFIISDKCSKTPESDCLWSFDQFDTVVIMYQSKVIKIKIREYAAKCGAKYRKCVFKIKSTSLIQFVGIKPNGCMCKKQPTKKTNSYRTWS